MKRAGRPRWSLLGSVTLTLVALPAACGSTDVLVGGQGGAAGEGPTSSAGMATAGASQAGSTARGAACKDSRQCARDQVCNEVAHKCVDCVQDYDCTGGGICVNSVCCGADGNGCEPSGGGAGGETAGGTGGAGGTLNGGSTSGGTAGQTSGGMAGQANSGGGASSDGGAGGDEGSPDSCVFANPQATVDDCVGSLNGCTGTTADAKQWMEPNPTGYLQTVGDLSMLPNGAFALTGLTSGKIDFGNGVTPPGSNNVQTIYTASFGSDGAAKWAKGVHSPNYAAPGGVAMDALGNVFVTGFFDTSIDFEDGKGPIPSWAYDAFEAGYDSEGTLKWARTLTDAPGNSGAKMQVGFAAAATGDGGSLFGGHIGGSVDFGGHTRTVVNATAYIVKRDASGERVWDDAFEADTSYVSGLAANDCGIWAYGWFNGTLNLLSKTLPGDAGQVFLLELDADGKLRSGFQFGSDKIDVSRGVAVNGDGHVAFVGNTYGAPNFGAGALAAGGGIDGFVAYLKSGTGKALWSAQIAGPDTQDVYDVAFDPFGNVLVMGNFAGAAVIETTAHPEGIAFNPSESAGLFVIKLDPKGDVVWAKTYANPPSISVGGIGTDADANVYLTGGFTDNLEALHSTGGFDAFMLKLNP